MLFYFVMVGSQFKDDINSARYGVGSRGSLTVIFLAVQDSSIGDIVSQ